VPQQQRAVPVERIDGGDRGAEERLHRRDAAGDDRRRRRRQRLQQPATTGNFYITAVAVQPGLTGGRAFAANDNGSIWENQTAGTTAPTEADMLAAPTVAIHPLH